MRNIDELKEICKLLRYDIVTATTAAGSGHPTSSLSAVELMATLFFGGFLKYDIKNHSDINNDRIIFSKGHAAPLLYSLYHVAGAITKDELLSLRQLSSNLEGHPTPRFPYVDVATGSLGQGLSIGLGMSLGLRVKISPAERGQSQSVAISNNKTKKQTDFNRFQLISTQHRLPTVWVLLGDSEMAEGQNWEAMEVASYYKVNNLVGIIDVSRLGQRGETMIGWNLEKYAQRVSSFGWNVITVEDGHDLKKVYNSYKIYNDYNGDKPTMIIAKTIKGKGISFLENKDGWHGKPIPKDLIDEALREIGHVDLKLHAEITKPQKTESSLNELKLVEISKRLDKYIKQDKRSNSNQFQPILTNFNLGDSIATRQAYGTALVALGERYQDMVVLDAEMANSLFEEEFAKKYPSRYFEMFIAEQNMISVALGLNKVGFTPFAASFGSFLSRSFDQIRMAQYSFLDETNVRANTVRPLQKGINIIGSHVGVSIGNDGSSQMALEDISMVRSILNSIVIYPSDAPSTVKLVEQMMENKTISYLRLTREKTPVIYDSREKFPIGGSKILRQSENDVAVIFAAGITLHEALKAHEILKKENINIAVVDLYSVKPIDIKTVQRLAAQTRHVIVVEDHYPAGGIGEAVMNALLSNYELPITNYEVEITNKQQQAKQIRNSQFVIDNFTHLCVRKIPHSGTPQELLHYTQIDADAIVKAVQSDL